MDIDCLVRHWLVGCAPSSIHFVYFIHVQLDTFLFDEFLPTRFGWIISDLQRVVGYMNGRRIQRAWRRYKTKGSQGAAQDGHGANVDNDANMSPALSETDEPTDASDSSNGQQAMSVSSPEEGDLVILKDCCGLDGKDWFRDVDSPPHGGTPSTASAPVIEPEPDSSVSDYSEMAEPIKEHLANVQIIQKEDLEVGNTIYPSQAASNQKIAREPNETDEEFTKRVRKINYLSLAQEFAALKKIDATALPFDMHKVQTKELSSPMSDSSATETDSSERCYPESAEASNAATPIEGFGDLLPNDNSGVQRRSTDPTGADVDNLSEQFYGAKVTSNQTQQSAPSGGGKANRGEVGGGSEMLDNELNRKLANGSSRSGNNDAFHEQNATEKKTSAGYTQADFDVYNIESTLPQMDWDLLEEQLHRAAEEERQKKEVS
ncbi:hypothetical protein LSH36_215g04029 [Paralvinella palmiformis]|uniref:Uncharacterized protein n=1 Tax=Paralvinella palmiformis TaxID=53620 RepID=A0AAD9JPS5_9ANNE|nr:hypothetical protein LSH36_215g04029 [Paralvinella palmiformis]